MLIWRYLKSFKKIANSFDEFCLFHDLTTKGSAFSGHSAPEMAPAESSDRTVIFSSSKGCCGRNPAPFSSGLGFYFAELVSWPTASHRALQVLPFATDSFDRSSFARLDVTIANGLLCPRLMSWPNVVTETCCQHQRSVFCVNFLSHIGRQSACRLSWQRTWADSLSSVSLSYCLPNGFITF